MKKTIERLRQKPKRERQKVAFGTALGVTLVIAIVWLSIVTTGLDGTPQTAQVSGPISAARDAFLSLFNK